MFAFTKEQKQAKLARANVDNYNKLELSLSSTSDELQREAISNSMADIVDIFTILRSIYDLSKPVKTIEDYRLLRVPGMPGIVLDYKVYADESINVRYSYHADAISVNHSSNIQPYLVNALQEHKLTQMEAKYKRKADKYGLTLPFSEDTYDTLLSLESSCCLIATNHIIVTNNYNREICQQFANATNMDILISI